MAMGQPESNVWNGLFWMIQLFICVNAIAKSFLQENRGRMLYFYSIVSPRDFILSKLLFNLALMGLMNIISLILFTFMLGNPLDDVLKFTILSSFGGMSLSLVFTFIAAIAARAQHNAALMAIMGFPLIIPQLLLLMRLSNIAFSPVYQSGLISMLLLIAALDAMVVALAVILFPYLWKD